MADAPIHAQGMTVMQLFVGRRFGLAYYQREYSWSRKNVRALVTDLHRRFTEQHDPLRRSRECPPSGLSEPEKVPSLHLSSERL